MVLGQEICLYLKFQKIGKLQDNHWEYFDRIIRKHALK